MIVVVSSWRGTGATTTALLAATCMAASEPTWLIEADPAGGVLAGRMRFDAHQIGGLERVAFPVERMSPAESFAAVAHQRGDLHIISAPADPFRGHSCHVPRVPWVPALHDLDGSVVIDIGRLRAAAPVRSLMTMADVVLMVTSPEVSAAVATAEWVHAAGRVSPGEPGLDDADLRVVVVDAPEGVGFDRATLEAGLAGHWGGWLPWEPVTVDLVHRGAGIDDRRLRRSALVSGVRRLVKTLQRSAEVVLR